MLSDAAAQHSTGLAKPTRYKPPKKSAYSGKFDVNYKHPKIAYKRADFERKYASLTFFLFFV
jgi:hypothetical protein